MPLFLVALIQKPTKKQEDEGQMEKLLMAPHPVIARDANSAAVKAVSEAKGEQKVAGDVDLGNVEVLVRPF